VISVNSLYKIVAALSLLVSFGLIAADNEQVSQLSQQSYESGQRKFSINFPIQWEVMQESKEESIVGIAPLSSPEDLFRENGNVIHAALDSNISVETFYNFNLNSLNVLLTDYDLEEKDIVLLNGNEAKRIVFTHTVGVLNAKVMQFLLLIGKDAYVLTFTADPIDFDQFRGVFEQIANTFQITQAQLQKARAIETVHAMPKVIRN
jgi:hypothetical protein